MGIQLEWSTAWKKWLRCGWAVSLADRRLYFTYVGGRKAKQSAADEYFNHAADRQRENRNKHMFIKQHKKV